MAVDVKCGHRQSLTKWGEVLLNGEENTVDIDIHDIGKVFFFVVVKLSNESSTSVCHQDVNMICSLGYFSSNTLAFGDL